MNNDIENRTTPAVAEARRQSDHGGVLRAMQNATDQRDTKRRKTLSGALPRSEPIEEPQNHFPQDEEIVISPPRKTPSKHRISLGAAHAYYFKSTSKTPFQKDSSFLDLNESANQYAGDVTANATELSFLSLAGSTGSSSTGSDALNRSVLSDTTELTASNFILTSSSRKMLAEFSKLAAEKKQIAKKENSLLQESSCRDGTGEHCLPNATTDTILPDQAAIKTLRSESISKERFDGNISSLSDPKKDTIEVRRCSMGTGSASRHVPSPVVTGRKSWHGTPRTIDVESSVMKYRELAATMKQVRLARDQQRQEEIKRRLSSQSNLSHTTERSDAVANASFLSTPSESSSSESRDLTDTDLSRKGDVSDVDSRSLDNLFEGLVPASASRSFPSASESNFQVLDSSGADDFCFSEKRPESNEQNLLDKSTNTWRNSPGKTTADETIVSTAPRTTHQSPVKKTSTQKALTPTKLSASPRRVTNPMSTDSPARNTRLATQSRLDTSTMSLSSVESEATPKSPSSSEDIEASARSPIKQTSAQKALTPTKLSTSPRRVANPMSTDSPARNTRLTTQSRLDTSTMSLSSVESEATPKSPSSSEDIETSARSPIKQTSTQKALTPTKLPTSPRRVANPTSTDSPARNTRSAQQAASDSSTGLTESSIKGKFSPSTLKDYDSDNLSEVTPSRNNRADHSSKNSNSEIVSLGSKRRQSSILNSALRKQGSARKVGSVHRHVEFGSPEFAEFNKGSPSMNLTPMPAKKLRIVEDLPEDTVEIEADMNALLNGVLPQSNFHLSNSAIENDAAHAKAVRESACDMSLESLSESKGQETVQLEVNMEELLKDPSGEKSRQFQDKSTHDMNLSARELVYDIEEETSEIHGSEPEGIEATNNFTVSLEANMSELLEKNSNGSIDKLGEETPRPLSDSFVNDISDDTPAATKNGNEIIAQEDCTVELEMDMSTLLMATAGETDIIADVSMNASPQTVGSRRRRSSISSRRFSLAPESRLSLSTDGQVFDKDDSSGDETGSETLTEMKETNRTTSELTFNWQSILSAFGVNFDKQPASSDFLEEVTSLLRDVEYGITLNAVFSQVVDHVEETTDPPLDLDTTVQPIDERNRDNLCSLQEAIKCGKMHEYEKNVGKLAQCVQATELLKWTSWLVSVADTLTGPMKDLCTEISQKTQSIDDSCSWIQESHQILSSLEQRAARRARKRSFAQRKLLVDELEAEVSELKEKLINAKEALEQTNDRYLRSVDTTNEIAKNRALVERKEILQPRAEDLARKYSYAKGIHRWKAPIISENEITFHYIGPTEDTRVVMTFTVSKEGEVNCVAKVANSIMEVFPENSRCLRIPLLTRFFKARTQALCTEWSGKVLSNASEISEVLRHFQWQMGRLEQTGMELLVLRRRYAAILTSSNDDVSTFKVEVDFSGMPSKLSASFELTKDYPFAPLNVILDSFEGSVDIEKIRKLLMKNAKPGVGYLSRTCDVISAFVQ